MGSQPIKTYDKVAGTIREYFINRHNIHFTSLGGLPNAVMKLVTEEMYGPVVKKKGNLMKFCSTWFSMTNIRGNMENHSVYGFVVFMERNYDVVVVGREKSIVKNLLIWALRKIEARNMKKICHCSTYKTKSKN